MSLLTKEQLFMAISPGSTLADYLVPSSKSRSMNVLRDILLIIGFSIFTALCAHVSFLLPFTPVPVTLQTLAVLLTGAALGSRRGGLSLLVYLAEGAAGLPVFSPLPPSPSGLAALFGFTGGYLWSFPVAAFVTGLISERRLDRRFLTSALAMLPGTLIIYAIGVPWLAAVLHLNLLTAIKIGMVPFIPGDLLKLAIAAALLPTTWAIVRRVKPEQE
jgi:biotin transport system substrate-specific component